MKENKIIKTIEEVNGYYADDGTWFRDKEECEKYENSARLVIFNMIKGKIIRKTTEYDLFGQGDCDHDIDIINVDSLETAELFNRYFSFCWYGEMKENVIKEDMVGKYILISWNYDHDWCVALGTIEDVLNKINQKYTQIMSQE